MIQTAIDYASELHKTGMSYEELSSVKDIFEVVPQVKEELSDPTVSLEKKHIKQHTTKKGREIRCSS